MWSLLAQVWQGFADNGMRLLFAADDAKDEKAREILVKAAEYNVSEKARLERAMTARGRDPATVYEPEGD